MSLQSITNLNVDFYDKKYILVNAKQYDKKSRFLLVACHDQDQFVFLDKNSHSAYIRYKKADDYGVFNFCIITDDGKIRVELTEQMLASDGICYAELVVVNKGSADVNTETGEIININDTSVLSTMTFCIDVSETVVANSDIESKYEINVLNETLEKYEAEYTNVVKTAKSWAVGGTGIRPNEDTDNSKYYSEQAYLTAVDASVSENNAKNSEENALEYMEDAEDYMIAAQDAALEINSRLNEMVDAFSPMGTITFAELQALKESGNIGVGYLYNISDSFTTDDDFREGAGVMHNAGTNVYYTATGKFDCLAGMAVTGIKGNNETDYRVNNVNITAENVGAIPSTDIATVDEVINYLGI